MPKLASIHPMCRSLGVFFTLTPIKSERVGAWSLLPLSPPRSFISPNNIEYVAMAKKTVLVQKVNHLEYMMCGTGAACEVKLETGERLNIMLQILYMLEDVVGPHLIVSLSPPW
jgi:hypothetical protein